ncbi:CmNV_070-like protein [Aratus pisonii nudivirus]|nr:CmNV_070-like protein [Aratus pisonii nudivirus]
MDKQKSINLISNLLDFLSNFQIIYNDYINILILKLSQIPVVEFRDVFYVNELTDELRMLSTDLNKRYGKYSKRYIKKLDNLRLNERYNSDYSKLINDISQLKENMSKGILDQNYKSIIESYDDIINRLSQSLKEHKSLIVKSTYRIMKPEQVDHLDNSIKALNNSINFLINSVEAESEPRSELCFEDVKTRNASELSFDDMRYSDLDDEDNMSSVSKSDFVMKNVETSNTLNDQYENILTMLGTILYRVSEDHTTDNTEKIEDLLNNFSVAIESKLQTISSSKTSESFTYGVEEEPIADIQTKMAIISTKIGNFDEKLKQISANLDESSEVINQLTGNIKYEVEKNLRTELTKFTKLINSFQDVRDQEQYKIYQSIIDKMNTIIQSKLLNEENIINVMNDIIAKIDTGTMTQVKEVLQTITKEFHLYIQNLKLSTKEEMETVYENVKDIMNKLKSYESSVKQQIISLKKNNTDMFKDLNTKVNQFIKSVDNDELKRQNFDLFNLVTNTNNEINNKLTNYLETSNQFYVKTNEKLNQQTITTNQNFETMNQQTALNIERNYETLKQHINEIYTKFNDDMNNVNKSYLNAIEQHNQNINLKLFNMEQFLTGSTTDIEEKVTKVVDTKIKEQQLSLEKLYSDYSTKQLEYNAEQLNYLKKYEKDMKKIKTQIKNLDSEMKKDQETMKQTIHEDYENLKKEIKDQTEEIFVKQINDLYAKISEMITNYIRGDRKSFVRLPILIKDIQKKQSEIVNISYTTNKLLKKEIAKIKTINDDLLDVMNKVTTSNELSKKTIEELNNINKIIKAQPEIVTSIKKRPILVARRDDSKRVRTETLPIE